MLVLLFLLCLCFASVTQNEIITENLIEASLQFATLLGDSNFTNARILCSADFQESDKFVEGIITSMMSSKQLLVSFAFVRYV